MSDDEHGERLTKSAARAERLVQRNRQQRELLRRAAGGMADHASRHAAKVLPKAIDGDPTAERDYLRAIRGRALGRVLVDMHGDGDG